jgi:hypothetical protein
MLFKSEFFSITIESNDQPAIKNRSGISELRLHILQAAHIHHHPRVPLPGAMQPSLYLLPPTGAASSHAASSSSSSMEFDLPPQVAQLRQPISQLEVRDTDCAPHATCVS